MFATVIDLARPAKACDSLFGVHSPVNPEIFKCENLLTFESCTVTPMGAASQHQIAMPHDSTPIGH
jgi:hypothetical protein